MHDMFDHHSLQSLECVFFLTISNIDGQMCECQVNEHCPRKVESKLEDFVSAIKGPFCLSLKTGTSFVATIVAFEDTFSLCSLACHVSPFPPLATTGQIHHGRPLSRSSAAIQASNQSFGSTIAPKEPR
jgi:hypothetical protein